MDIEKLIEQLNDFNENHIAVLCGSGQFACGYLCDKDDCIVVRAATAITDLLEEVEKEKKEVKRWCAACAEQYKLIEKLEEERDAAVEQLRGDCEKCLHYMVTWNGCTPDFSCPLSDTCLNRDMWEWNGGKEEE